MRILAIDTALEACSVAVLDTGRTGTAVEKTLQESLQESLHESLPMVRGHAEA